MLITAPSCQPFETPVIDKSSATSSFRAKLPKVQTFHVICFTDDFDTLP
jgi:hypothetical protein